MNSGEPAERPAKILLTKIGMDGHDRGSRLIATFLRDAGMEVVYTGPWQRIADVVNMAIEEDVDLIGISSLATDHLIAPKLMQALQRAGLGHVAVVLGGIVPDSEVEMLLEAGVSQVFHPGADRDEIVDRIAELVDEARKAEVGLV